MLFRSTQANHSCWEAVDVNDRSVRCMWVGFPKVANFSVNFLPSSKRRPFSAVRTTTSISYQVSKVPKIFNSLGRISPNLFSSRARSKRGSCPRMIACANFFVGIAVKISGEHDSKRDSNPSVIYFFLSEFLDKRF